MTDPTTPRSTTERADRIATLEVARRAKRAGEILAREGQATEAALAFDRSRSAYALLLGDDAVDARALDALDARAVAAVWGPGVARRRRLARVAVFVALAVGTFAYVAFALGARPFARAVGSETFDDNPLFAAEKAVDGQTETEWLLPDGRGGTLDLVVFPARDVRSVVIQNGHNRQFHDRAVRRFEVQFFRDGVRVRSLRDTFLTMDGPDATKTLRLDPPLPDVDHVRFVVLDHHGLGASLAEIRLR